MVCGKDWLMLFGGMRETLRRRFQRKAIEFEKAHNKHKAEKRKGTLPGRASRDRPSEHVQYVRDAAVTDVTW